MIITIQSINKRFVISQVTEITSFHSLNDATRYADKVSNFVHNLKGVRPTIKILPVQHTPMKKPKKVNKLKKAVTAKAKKMVKSKKK